MFFLLRFRSLSFHSSFLLQPFTLSLASSFLHFRQSLSLSLLLPTISFSYTLNSLVLIQAISLPALSLLCSSAKSLSHAHTPSLLPPLLTSHWFSSLRSLSNSLSHSLQFHLALINLSLVTLFPHTHSHVCPFLFIYFLTLSLYLFSPKRSPL